MPDATPLIPAIWTLVEPTLPVLVGCYRLGKHVNANAVVVGLGGGKLLLLSPPSPPDADALHDALAKGCPGLPQGGEVIAIASPSQGHTAGLAAAASRWPSAQVYAPADTLPKAQALLPAERTVQPLSALASTLPVAISLVIPPYQHRSDAIGRFRTDAGTVWYVNDLITNMTSLPEPWLLRTLLGLLGFATCLRPNRFAWRRRIVSDASALSAWFAQELSLSPPVALVVGHGPPIVEPQALAALHETIDALR